MIKQNHEDYEQDILNIVRRWPNITSVRLAKKLGINKYSIATFICNASTGQTYHGGFGGAFRRLLASGRLFKSKTGREIRFSTGEQEADIGVRPENKVTEQMEFMNTFVARLKGLYEDAVSLHKQNADLQLKNEQLEVQLAQKYLSKKPDEYQMPDFLK